jgi:hypothetical protein
MGPAGETANAEPARRLRDEDRRAHARGRGLQEGHNAEPLAYDRQVLRSGYGPSAVGRPYFEEKNLLALLFDASKDDERCRNQIRVVQGALVVQDGSVSVTISRRGVSRK